MKEQIKELRIRIDGVSQLVKDLDYSHLEVDLALKHQGESIEQFTKRCDLENLGKKVFKQSNERTKTYESLILAKAWLGKVLGELGESTPYVNDGNRKTVEDIEPTADIFGENILTKNKEGQLINNPMVLLNNSYGTEGNTRDKAWKDLNHIEKVDWLREEIQRIINDLSKWYTHILTPTREFNIARTNSYNHLCEARFWLGFELEHIRESSTSNI